MKLDLFIKTNLYDTQRSKEPTPQIYFDMIVSLFNQYSLNKENVSSAQWQKLQDIIDSKNLIVQILEPLKELGGYQLDIVGGALRDIMLNQPDVVKDFDIVISAEYIDKDSVFNLAQKMNIEINLEDRELKNIKEFVIKERKEQLEIKGVSWDKKNDEGTLINEIEKHYYFSKIVNLLMKDTKDYQYYGANKVREKYMNFHIMSINQFKGKNDTKIDLIVSDYGGVAFLSTFDFELCKIKADLKKCSTKEELLEQIVPLGSMLRDVEDKTFSVKALKFPIENLTYFFRKHLLKLQEKFPEYKVNLFSIKKVEEFTDMEKQRWIIAHQLKMEAELPQKGYIGKKIKI